MAYTRVITGAALIGALAIAPVFASADEGQRRRSGSDRRENRGAEQASRGDARQGARSRESQPQAQAPRRQEDQRRSSGAGDQDQRQRQYAVPRQSAPPRQYEAQRPYPAQRPYEAQRQYDTRRYNDSRAYQRPYYSNRGGYGSRTVIVPRYIRPSIVTIVPYRPYVYRPRFGMGVYYGDGGSYPYGYTPRGYFDPIPGRIYGGLRITDAPREAQVFADGYYIGIVDDFDGIFQHANLEAGTHRIEIQAPGFESVAFDVMVQPGRTITFRADMYPY